jgi:hypothetical protein
MTPAQRRVLETATERERGNVCPTVGIYAGAQDALLRSLRTRGWITDEPAPKITTAGRQAVSDCTGSKK